MGASPSTREYLLSPRAKLELAQRRGADMYESGDRRYEGFFAWWWLRWPGSYGNATYLYSSGDIFNDFGVECASGVVRPALWVAL